MKTWNDLTLAARESTAILFANWLKPYTHDVIVKVMKRRDEIINNEFAMNLLHELRLRDHKEEKEFYENITWLFNSFDANKEYDPHNHPLTHAGSYRDILYDMYIR